MTKHLVFVYGTLLSGQSNHHWLDGARCMASEAWTFGELVDVGAYPALVLGGTKKVTGELYQVDGEKLKQLDILEDYQVEGQENEYERIRETVYTDQGTQEAWVYVYTEERATSCPAIDGGDWRKHLR
ncbi:gamma-glutamylcyclotransferase [Ammoniphilus sp. CFH 90114]|uniref:gamma-glutamylcyclotransferase family protein n=1 Tax=Ammoniphilus sp. CFH 90114 TaxID=2493665 RepID=UPI00100E38DB|nr:gamma-glutamylcyclotransferase family protein [Ammoniphilus sp. CFH 90114]RXT06516.1 gamma-glutamylcyclotransferase [Ammoniphilus sp. CFH 90114]